MKTPHFYKLAEVQQNAIIWILGSARVSSCLRLLEGRHRKRKWSLIWCWQPYNKNDKIVHSSIKTHCIAGQKWIKATLHKIIIKIKIFLARTNQEELPSVTSLYHNVMKANLFHILPNWGLFCIRNIIAEFSFSVADQFKSDQRNYEHFTDEGVNWEKFEGW